MSPSSVERRDGSVHHGLTIFAVPKPFVGHASVIQENALQSWTRLPRVEVVLFGDDEGVAEAAANFEILHEPDVRCSEFGTPLLNDVFHKARYLGTSETLCYVNADIILFEDFLEAGRLINFKAYLGVGQRINLDVSDRMDLGDPELRNHLRSAAHSRGVLEPPWGSDFFIYPRSIDWGLPEVAVGRAGWDNWMIFRARRLGLPVVDITGGATVVHQNHGYEHVPERRGRAWQGPETDRNIASFENPQLVVHLGTLDSATHLLRRGKLRKALGFRYLRARLLRIPVERPALRSLFDRARRAYRWGKSLFAVRKNIV